MIRDLGVVEPGTTLYVPFHTFDSNDPSASVTLTGLATTDIEIYSNGSVTQRASDNGYTLLDTDGIDFDGITGIHGLSINLADNSTAGFYAAGTQYWVVISSVTVDAATINFVLCTFRIGYRHAILNTTIATLSSQTSFTLTVGPAEDDALNGCVVCIHDVASAVQLGFDTVVDYTGSTKTVTLRTGVTFTAAATDNISFFPPSNAAWGGTVLYTATRGLSGTALPAAAADAAGGLAISDAGGLDLDAILADTNELQTDWVNGGRLDLLIDAILADTNELQVDWVNGGRLDLLIDAIKAKTDNLPADPADASDVAAAIAALNDLSAAEVNAEVVDALATDTYAEPTGVPGATIALSAKIGWLFMALRNSVTVTSTKKTFLDDGGAAEWEKDLSDDGTTYTESEGNAP